MLVTYNETSTGVTNPLRGAGRSHPRRGPRHAHPRRRRERGRCHAHGDGRLGPRRRRHRLPEGLDDPARAGHGRRVRACLGRRRDGDHAALLLRPRQAPRRAAQGPDAVDARGGHLLPARRRARASWRPRAARPSTRATRPVAPRLAPASRPWASTSSPTRPFASNTVTSALVPEGVDWSALNQELRAGGLVLAGGQGKMKGKLFRIGHLGDVSVDDIVSGHRGHRGGAVAHRPSPIERGRRSRRRPSRRRGGLTDARPRR